MESFEQNNCGAAGQSNQSQDAGGGWVHTDSSVRPMTPHLFRADCKAEGRNALLGHLGTAVGASAAFWGILILMRLLIMNVLPDGNGLLITLLAELLTLFVCVFSGIYEYGLTCIFMKLQYQQEAVFSDLFLGIHENQDKLVKLSRTRRAGNAGHVSFPDRFLLCGRCCGLWDNAAADGGRNRGDGLYFAGLLSFVLHLVGLSESERRRGDKAELAHDEGA